MNGMMEIILSVAIILILGSVLVVSTNTSFRGSILINETLKQAQTINKIDRAIRESADSLYIPYFKNPDSIINDYIQGLYRTNTGSYLKNVIPIYDSKRINYGVEALYSVNGREQKTVAIFNYKNIRGME